MKSSEPHAFRFVPDSDQVSIRLTRIKNATNEKRYQPRIARDILAQAANRRLAVMARSTQTNRWFVSIEVPRQLLPASSRTPARQTKTFATEAEAKQFAREMLLAERKNIIAGTLLGADQTERRIITGAKLYRWIEEEETNDSG